MKKVIEVTVKGKEWEEAQTNAFNKLNSQAKIDGFRAGKAPRAIFEKKYGTGDIVKEAADTVIQKKYEETIIKEKIIPVMQPKVDFTKIDEKELAVKFTFILEPTVKLGEYKNLDVKKETVKVSKEEIDHQIKHMLEHYAEMVAKDGKVESGDTAIIDFEGFKDGVAFDGGKAENYSLEIGSNSFIPGFEEGLIGLAKDEVKELNLTFPKDYASEELKGKEVVFKVKVNDIKQRIIPELNKDFFEDLSIEGVNSKEDLEKMVKEEIKEQKEKENDNKYIDSLLEKACKNMTIELDEELIEQEADQMYQEFLNKMSMQGITEDIYLQYANTTKEDIMKQMKTEAEHRLQSRYLLNAIIKEEKIKVTDKEAKDYIKDMAKQYNVTEEEVLKEFGELETVKYELMFKKAIDVLKGNN